jgi:peptidyl-prolyl cis-trans isomerase A (cyclophilin A)
MYRYDVLRSLKSILIILALSCPLHAELLAHLQTTQGEVIIELQYTKAPQAVANFITLSQGTRKRLDMATGTVTNRPFYIGEKFFRVINDASFKIAQTGSGNGTNVGGGPGYTFKDEFDATLTHIPYVLSMANGGPNTNGSQIFLTGNATIPSLNNVHTIFGLVKDSASRVVVDAIHAAGNDGTTITGLTFQRTDAAAIAFNEFAQSLPVADPSKGSLAVSRNISTNWALSEIPTTGDIFRAFKSTSLQSGSWSELSSARRHQGFTAPGFGNEPPTVTLDSATSASAFYNLSIVHHPGSVAPSSLNNRTVAIAISGGVISYAHNATATGGTATYSPNNGDPLTFPFASFNFLSGGHDIQFIAQNIGIDPEYVSIKIGCDSASISQISGRHSSSYYDNLFGWQPWSSGPAAMSR